MMRLSIRQTLYFLLTIITGFIASATLALAENGFWNEQSNEVSSSNNSSSVSAMPQSKQVINVTGSTTVSNVLNILADRFEQNYKKSQIHISGGGSSSAVKAMLAHPDTIGQMSRAMKAKERAAFVKHYGYEATEFKVAVDALAIYVNKNNPVKQLSIVQLADVFSKKSPHVTAWGHLNLAEIKTDNWQNQTIQIYTLPTIAGAYSLFNKRILNKSGYKISAVSQPTSSSVVQSTGVDPGGITFSSSFFKTRRTHFVALEGKDGQFYQPVQPWISSFQYPLSRYLYLYINKKPGTSMALKNKQFLQFLMAEGTQTLIKRAGFYSVSKKIRQQQLNTLEH